MQDHRRKSKGKSDVFTDTPQSALSERGDEVPFLKRSRYHGAKEVCVVLTHPAHRKEAVEIIQGMDKEMQNKIILPEEEK